MTKAIKTVALLAMTATSNAFAPAPHKKALTASFAASNHLPHFIDLVEPPPSDSIKVTKNEKVAAKKHQEGLFSPIVIAAKKLIGEKSLNKLRGDAISLHSSVITSFVDTAETPFGKTVLKTLFSITDKDASGTIEEQELKQAFNILGFTWLQDKQVRGILERADSNQDGRIDMDEWINEAPKTLRTNLIKLAKKNGGELGFLS